MELTVIEYGGEPRQIECESFEFRCNHVTNWIRAMHADGSEEMVHDVCVIKTDNGDPKAGHWMGIENEEMEVIDYFCSECDMPMQTEEKTAFCPSCGAKMRGDT